MVKKVVRDGKVAVCVSPGFGAGWTTCNPQVSPFDPAIVAMIEAGRQSEITEEWVAENLGMDDVYTGGAKDLVIVWIPEGTLFQIREYDGSEIIEMYRAKHYILA